MQFWKKLTNVSQYGSSIIITVFTNVILAILSIFTGILVARILGPEGRGELLIIQIYSQFFAIITLLGMSDAVAYYSAENPKNAAGYLVSAIFIALISSIIFSFIGYFVISRILQQYSNKIISSARIYLLFLPINALLLIFIQSLRGRNKIVTWNLLRILPTLFWLFVLLLSFKSREISPGKLALQYLISLALLIIIFGSISLKDISGTLRISKPINIKLLKYGIPVALGGLPLALNLRLDQLVLPRYVDARLIGLYVIAVSYSTMTNPIVNAISEVMLPRIAGKDPGIHRNEILAQTIRLGLLISLVIGILTAIFAPVVIPILFGTAYVDAINVSVILSFASCFIAFNQILRSGALSVAQPKIVFIVESLGFVSTLVLLYLLLFRYNIIGAALASLISYVIISLGFVVGINATTKIALLDMLIPKRQDLELILYKGKLLFNSYKVNW